MRVGMIAFRIVISDLRMIIRFKKIYPAKGILSIVFNLLNQFIEILMPDVRV